MRKGASPCNMLCMHDEVESSAELALSVLLVLLFLVQFTVSSIVQVPETFL